MNKELDSRRLLTLTSQAKRYQLYIAMQEDINAVLDARERLTGLWIKLVDEIDRKQTQRKELLIQIRLRGMNKILNSPEVLVNHKLKSLSAWRVQDIRPRLNTLDIEQLRVVEREIAMLRCVANEQQRSIRSNRQRLEKLLHQKREFWCAAPISSEQAKIRLTEIEQQIVKQRQLAAADLQLMRSANHND